MRDEPSYGRDEQQEKREQKRNRKQVEVVIRRALPKIGVFIRKPEKGFMWCCRCHIVARQMEDYVSGL